MSGERDSESDSDVVLIGITNPRDQGRFDMLANEASDRWTELHSIEASGCVQQFKNWVKTDRGHYLILEMLMLSSTI